MNGKGVLKDMKSLIHMVDNYIIILLNDSDIIILLNDSDIDEQFMISLMYE